MSTVDVTITQTVSTTTTTIVTSTATSAPVCGVNIVSNPGFTSGVYVGASLASWNWLPGGYGRYSFVQGPGNTVSDWLALNIYTNTPGSSSPTISQSLSTVSGRTYDFNFMAFSVTGNTASTLTCKFNNDDATYVAVGILASRGQWLSYQTTFVASSSSTLLTCQLSTSVSTGIYLTDVSVVLPC